jgi:hypothetical protein
MPKSLYVWTDELTDWTHGIVVALADSEEKARAAVAERDPFAAMCIKPNRPKVYGLNQKAPAVFVVHGS